MTRISAAALAPRSASAFDRSRDRVLLQRVTRGDVAALRTLYDQHAPRAMAIALRILRNPQEAEDVVQETFLALWRRAAHFDANRAGAAAFVVTIARSRAIDRMRALVAARRARGGAAMENVMPTAFVSPADEAQGRRDEARVGRALGSLPPRQRETIELAYFEGLSQSEIAVRTGTPLGTVKARIKVAIHKLARLLEGDRGSPGRPRPGGR